MYSSIPLVNLFSIGTKKPAQGGLGEGTKKPALGGLDLVPEALFGLGSCGGNNFVLPRGSFIQHVAIDTLFFTSFCVANEFRKRS